MQPAATPSVRLCIALLAAMVLLFFVPRLLLHPGHILAGIDVQEHSYWDARYIKERLLSLSLPLWNPHSYAGHPFLANFGVYFFYPSTLLTAALPLPWAFAADTLLHTFAAGVGMFLLVRRLSASVIGGLAAAVIYAFNGHAVDRIYAGHLNILHSVTWFPWIAFALEEGLRTRRAQWSVLCGLFLALAFLGGHPQAPYYFCLVLPLYCLGRALAGRSLAPMWALALAVVIALLVSAVQILPSMEFASLSDRAATDFQFATFMSFPPANLGTFIVPHLSSPLVDPNWEYTCYPGLAGLVFAGIALCQRRDRLYAMTLLAITGFAITVMLGHYTPLYRIYYAVLPGLSRFRFPPRCAALVVFSLAILAGLGVAASLSPAAQPRGCMLLIGWTFAVIATVLAVTLVYGQAFTAATTLSALAFAAWPLLILPLSAQPNRGALAAVLVVAALFADLLVNFGPRVPLLPVQTVDTVNTFERIAQRGAGTFRVASPAESGRAIGLGYDSVNAYAAIAIGNYFRFVHEMAGVQPSGLRRHALDPEVFSREHSFMGLLLNVRYWVDPSGHVFEQHQANPRAFLVHESVVEADFGRQLALLRSGKIDPRRSVVVERAPAIPADVVETSAQPETPDTTQITEYAPERVEVKTTATTPTFLVLSDQYYPGWQATIDGHATQIVRANCVVRAVALPAGSHTVLFSYRPKPFYLGALISGSTLLAIVVWWSFGRRRR